MPLADSNPSSTPETFACPRCGSDEWEYIDYGGCSVCRSYEDRAAEDAKDENEDA